MAPSLISEVRDQHAIPAIILWNLNLWPKCLESFLFLINSIKSHHKCSDIKMFFQPKAACSIGNISPNIPKAQSLPSFNS